VDGYRTDASRADQICVPRNQFLYEAELVVTVGKGVMDEEGGLGLSATNGQPEIDKRRALVEVHGRTFSGWIVELHHRYSGVE
jgi:hypothetical protein